ncbi:hypothetical protein ACRARG_03860 [Pseudooceanicola sp. C21-150M6]|uniref:LysM peptidoglycan-binding domain-containing protein n=1 Tax=Pseudooceanicola sp. C21-150M6 TaxID=3434355 RepID=UPI003D7FCB60
MAFKGVVSGVFAGVAVVGLALLGEVFFGAWRSEPGTAEGTVSAALPSGSSTDASDAGTGGAGTEAGSTASGGSVTDSATDMASGTSPDAAADGQQGGSQTADAAGDLGAEQPDAGAVQDADGGAVVTAETEPVEQGAQSPSVADTGAADLDTTDTAATDTDTTDTAATDTAATDTGASDTSVATDTDSAAAPTDTTDTAEATPDAAGDTPTSTAPGQAPGIDVVRVEPDGSGLIAGQAQPDMPVDVLIDGEVVATEIAGPDGKFVVFLDLPPSDLPRVLTLRTGTEEMALSSNDQVILGPTVMAAAPEATGATSTGAASTGAAQEGTAGDAPVTTAATSTDPSGSAVPADATGGNTTAAGTADATTTAGVASTSSPATAGAEAVAAAAADGDGTTVPEQSAATSEAGAGAGGDADAASAQMAAVSPTVLLQSDDGVTVLQSSAPRQSDTVAIDAISYSDLGDVQLSGRGVTGQLVRIYLNGAPVSESRIGQDGIWRTALPEVDTGVYNLRIDSLGADGKVASRVETPFKREAPELAALASQSQVTVQPGFTLWAIATRKYGDGLLYVKVFEANKGLIRDPDLIYPGQVFELPEQ